MVLEFEPVEAGLGGGGGPEGGGGAVESTHEGKGGRATQHKSRVVTYGRTNT